MLSRMRTTLALLALALAACTPPAAAPAPPVPRDLTGATPYPANPAEPHLAHLRMLTHAGENAEAYYAYDGKRLTLKHTGRFQDASSEQTRFRLTWDVDVDAPVVEYLGAGKK